ncbi:MAG: thioredoxin domain-containing protein [Solirubrobacterales bacterium]
MVHDVDEAGFQQQVIERSREVPVVVDFWAEWCGPCRQLGPALEAEANAREGDVDLAKVDVDSNQRLAQAFGIQGIPAVKAFKDGEIAAEFTGALPPARVAEFFEGLVPSEAAKLAAAADEDSLRRALELDPRQSDAAVKLAHILLTSGETEEARSLLEPLESDFTASGLLARIELTESAGDDLSPAFEAWDSGDHETALEALQGRIAVSEDAELTDRLRRVMVAIFTELGPASELAREHRRRLAAAIV